MAEQSYDMTDEHFAIYLVALNHQHKLSSDELVIIQRIDRRLKNCPKRGRFTFYRERQILSRIQRKLSTQVDLYRSKNRVDHEITRARLQAVRQLIAQ